MGSVVGLQQVPHTNSGRIDELIGVYDADSTIIGEVSYWIGARLGRTHCSLCELTHGVFTQKSEWKTCSRNLAVPFVTFHRNDAPVDVIECAAGQYPVVMARLGTRLKVILDRDGLEKFGGNTELFGNWLRDATTGA